MYHLLKCRNRQIQSTFLKKEIKNQYIDYMNLYHSMTTITYRTGRNPLLIEVNFINKCQHIKNRTFNDSFHLNMISRRSFLLFKPSFDAILILLQLPTCQTPSKSHYLQILFTLPSSVSNSSINANTERASTLIWSNNVFSPSNTAFAVSITPSSISSSNNSCNVV